jgi:hypothetical protein
MMPYNMECQENNNILITGCFFIQRGIRNLLHVMGVVGGEHICKHLSIKFDDKGSLSD